MRFLRFLYPLIVVAVFVLTPSPANAWGIDITPDCKEAPIPESPGGGITGFFIPAPPDTPGGDAWVNGAPSFEHYGMAGLSFHVYDLGCGPDFARHPDAVLGTTMANWMLEMPKFAVSGTVAFLGAAYHPTYLQVFDPLLTSTTATLRTTIFEHWAPVAVTVVGLMILWGARKMHVASAMTAVTWALLVVIAASFVFAFPLKAGRFADASVGATLGAVNGGINGQTAADPVNAAAGGLSNTVLFEQWKMGTFGQGHSPTVDKWAKDIYTGQALTYAEAKTVHDDPDGAGKKLIEDKQKQWIHAADEIKKTDPDTYQYLTGKRAATAFSAALISWWAAICTIPFLLVSALLMIGSYLIIRLAVMFFPVVATVGIVYQARGAVMGLVTVVMAAVINSVLFGVGASVTLLAIRTLLSPTSGLPLWLALVLMGLFSFVMWVALKPMRKLTSMASGSKVFRDASGALSDKTKAAGAAAGEFGKQALAAYVGGGAALAGAGLSGDDKKDAATEAPEERSEGFTNDPEPTEDAPLVLEAASDRTALPPAPVQPNGGPLPPGAPERAVEGGVPVGPAAETTTEAATDAPEAEPALGDAPAVEPGPVVERAALPPGAPSYDADEPDIETPVEVSDPLPAMVEPTIDEATGEEVYELFMPPPEPATQVTNRGNHLERDDGLILGAWRDGTGDGWVGRDESFTDYEAWRAAAEGYIPERDRDTGPEDGT